MRSITLVFFLSCLVLLYSCNGRETDSHDHTDDEHSQEQISGHDNEYVTAQEHADDHDLEQAEHDHADDQAQEQVTEPDDEAHEHEQEIYNVSTLKASGFSFVYKTSGQVLSDRKDEILVTAPVSGIISFHSSLLYPGIKVSPGQQLFSVSGNNITESNPEVYYREREAEYLAAKKNFERAEKLVADRLITDEHYLESKLAYEKASTIYDNVRNTFTSEGSIIASPAGGYINDLYVAEGQMVRAGERIASLITGNKLVLKADIPPADLDVLEKTRKANFATGYSPRIFSTDKMNGSIISYGRSTGKNSYYVPLYFRIDRDDELIPGTFADVWLIGEKIQDVITVPNTALMEEYGKIYVFRENESGEFEKTYITAGQSDAKVTHVLEGLKEGDRIVTKNTYRMKLSLQETALPSHSGHNH